MLAVLTCLVLLLVAALWLGWMWLSEKRRADGLAGLASALAGHAAGLTQRIRRLNCCSRRAAASFCWRKAATTAPASSPTWIPVPAARPIPAPPKRLS